MDVFQDPHLKSWLLWLLTFFQVVLFCCFFYLNEIHPVFFLVITKDFLSVQQRSEWCVTVSVCAGLTIGGLAEERGCHRSIAGLQLPDHHRS